MACSPVEAVDENEVTSQAKTTLHNDVDLLHQEEPDESLEFLLKLALGEINFARYDIANACQIFRDLKTAIAFYEICLNVAKEIGDRPREGRAYGNIGNLYYDLGDFNSAVAFHELCLEIMMKEEDKSEEGYAYSNLGNCYLRLGEFRKALKYHELHFEIAKEMGDTDGQGCAYSHLGSCYYRLGNLKRAIDYDEISLKIAQEAGDRAAEGRAYGNLGAIYESLGDFQKALDYQERNLVIAKEVGNKIGEGLAYSNLGNVYQDLGMFSRAKEYYQRHRDIIKEVGDKAGEGLAHHNLGNAYCNTGDFRNATSHYKLTLNVAKEVGDRAEEGAAYGDLGIAFNSLGDFKQALECHERQLQIAKQVEDKVGEGLAYTNIGNDYHGLGDFKRAIAFHKLFLNIAEELGNSTGKGRAYGSLGNAYCKLVDFKRAVYYYELDLNISKDVKDECGEGQAYGNLGNAYQCLGDYQTAIAYHKRHLRIAKEIGDKAGEGVACANLGSAYCNIGDLKNAITYHNLDLRIAREVGDKVGEGKAYGNLGIAYCSLGDYERSISYHKDDLKIAKETGDRAGEGDAYANLGKAYCLLEDFQRAKSFYYLQLEIAKEVGNKLSEGRAYFGLGFCFQTSGSLQEAVDCFQSSIEAFNDVRARLQDNWKISLRERDQEAYSALMRVLLKQGKENEALSAVEQGRAQALKDLMLSNYEPEKGCSESATKGQITYDVFNCTPSNTVFTAIDEELIISWVIQNNRDAELRVVEICHNTTEDACTSTFLDSLVKSAYDVIGVRTDVKCEDRSLGKQISKPLVNERYRERGSHSDHFQTTDLRALYDIVIGPIEDLVHGEELIVVPDGPLWSAPYAAFMDSSSKYLSEKFRIRVIPSLTSLKLIADCPSDYHSKTGALLVGDPWTQEISSYQEKNLQQLPYARKEVEMIGRIINNKPLVGREATKDIVLERISSVSLVHIAAHGRMETGEIALAPNPSRASQVPKEEDFLLIMSDVLNVKLRARLVVLSCCHSGRGEIKAEGVVGIARAFLGAGARSVLVSLWAIDDEATLEFMKNFYQNLVEGRSASEAVSCAMRSMRESKEFNEVRYWAPFVLIGDDVTLDFGGKQ